MPADKANAEKKESELHKRMLDQREYAMNIFATAYCELSTRLSHAIRCQPSERLVVTHSCDVHSKTINNSVFFYCSHSISSVDLDRIAYPVAG